MNRSEKNKTVLFAAICLACLVAVIISAIVASRRSQTPIVQNPPLPPKTIATGPVPSSPAEPPKKNKLPAEQEESGSAPAPVPAITKPTSKATSKPPASEEKSLLYFRTNALGPHYGQLAVAPLAALDHVRYSPALSCERVYFAGGAGVCLVADRGMFTTFSAVLFNQQLQGGKTISLNGEPSRTRVSPHGRRAAITVFLSGHSYSSLAFSTQTTIVDVPTGKTLCDLEQFSVTRNGSAFQSPDFNFWGVTFAHDENHFYATLWTKGKTYLIEGNLQARTARVIYDDVECPSLSPDNLRIAFKKRIGPEQPGWHIHLLDLKTLRETALGETRNVDDQVEWLDNGHILYALSENPNGASASTDLWELSTNPQATPRLFLKGAFSPAVVNPNR